MRHTTHTLRAIFWAVEFLLFVIVLPWFLAWTVSEPALDAASPD